MVSGPTAFEQWLLGFGVFLFSFAEFEGAFLECEFFFGEIEFLFVVLDAVFGVDFFGVRVLLSELLLERFTGQALEAEQLCGSEFGFQGHFGCGFLDEVLGEFGIGHSFALKDSDNFKQGHFFLAVFAEFFGVAPDVPVFVDFMILDLDLEGGAEEFHDLGVRVAVLEPGVKLVELGGAEILDLFNGFCFSHKLLRWLIVELVESFEFEN